MENNNQSTDPLDQPDLNVIEYFHSFIKPKKIDDLIAYDNKLFSEVRNLESEKHVLVTQNYKKFVSATETINTIKTSLVGFEKDLLNLQGKVQSLVSNFTSINSGIEDKLKKTEEVYKIKKDLKRLKFISDLPNVLEKQLNLYYESPDKNISILETSLNYYQKCKEFLKIHKDNTLVKDIYTRTNDLIYKYRSYITDEMNIPDFNETQLDKFETCLSLLVKINDDKNELIKIFIDKYKYLITNKYEQMFAEKNKVNEITYEMYNKIYDNYEFAINENDFLFYESEILKNTNPQQGGTTSSTSSSINLNSLSSKYFKKGTFIWICKQIVENIIKFLLCSGYERFVKLFEKDNTKYFAELITHSINQFKIKLNIILDKTMYDNKIHIDPIFFREALLTVYRSFVIDLLQKINDDNIDNNSVVQTIIQNNKLFIQMYLSNVFCAFINETNISYNERVVPLKYTYQSEGMLCDNFVKLNRKKYENQITNFAQCFEEILKKFSMILNNINLNMFNENDAFGNDDIEKVYINLIKSFFTVFTIQLQSFNKHKYQSLNYYANNTHIHSFIDENSLQIFKNKIKLQLYPFNYEHIYFAILLIKHYTQANNIKTLIERLLYDFSYIKKNKVFNSELKTFIEKELKDTMIILYDALIHITDNKIFTKLNELILSFDFISISESPATVRLDMQKICYDLYQIKLDIMEILDEESKIYKENKKPLIADSFSQGMFNKKNKSVVQIEMEKLQIRRLGIYGEIVDSPQMILFVIVKIFLKIMNEMIKIKKFSEFGYQQIQVDLNYINLFFRENIIGADVVGVLEGFANEINLNCEFNTVKKEGKVLSEEEIANMLVLPLKEFKDKQVIEQEL